LRLIKQAPRANNGVYADGDIPPIFLNHFTPGTHWTGG